MIYKMLPSIQSNTILLLRVKVALISICQVTMQKQRLWEDDVFEGRYINSLHFIAANSHALVHISDYNIPLNTIAPFILLS